MLSTSTSHAHLRRLRRGHRGHHRERGGQDGDLSASWRRCCEPDAILASNTSTISITRMAESAPDPDAVRRHALLLPGRPDGAGRGHPRREDERRDGGDDRRPGQADPQDADRRPRLPGLPGQPRPLPLHERGADPAGRGGVDGRDRRGGRRGSACRWARSPCTTSSASTRPATPARCCSHAYPDRAVPTPILGDLVKAGRLGQEVGGGVPQVRAEERRPEADPAVRRHPGEAPDRRSDAGPTTRSPTACSCRCCWRRPGCSKRGSSASRPTSTWA